MQALTLYPGEVTAKSTQAAPSTQTTDYDNSRDTTAQPSNAWFDHSQAYHHGHYTSDNGYYSGYNGYGGYGNDYDGYDHAYGTYDEENTDHPDAYENADGVYSSENPEDLEVEWDQQVSAANEAEAAASAGQLV